MIYSAFVAVLFRIINLGILIALGIYVYKKYLKKPLDDDLTREQHVRKALEHGLHDAKKNSQIRAQQLADDTELIATLTEKIIRWRKVQHRVLLEREQYKERQIAYFKAQVPLKQQRIAEYMAERSGMTEIIEQSRAILVERFSDPKTVRSYTQKAVSLLNHESESHERR